MWVYTKKVEFFGERGGMRIKRYLHFISILREFVLNKYKQTRDLRCLPVSFLRLLTNSTNNE